MTLGEIIKRLEREPQDKVIPHGFGRPCSYRGYYDQLAFRREENIKVVSMLIDAQGAVDHVFDGYKGGSYKMDLETYCWLVAEARDCGDWISESMLTAMLEAGDAP